MLLKHPQLRFKHVSDAETKDQEGKAIANFGPMQFIELSESKWLISGSLHYLYNYLFNKELHFKYASKYVKGFNGNDFGFLQMQHTVNLFSEIFSINPEDLKIKNLEFGFNLVSPVPVEHITRYLFLHHGKEFKSIKTGDYQEVDHSKYALKVYHKGLQFGLDIRLLRIELKYKCIENLKKMGILSINDILDLQKIELLIADLIKEWEKTLLFDSTLNSLAHRMTPREQKLVSKYSNKTVWLELPVTARARPKARMRQLEKKYSVNLKQEVSKLIESKARHLILPTSV